MTSLRISKQVIRNVEKETKLHAINSERSNILQGKWLSEKCINAVLNFLSKREKLLTTTKTSVSKKVYDITFYF